MAATPQDLFAFLDELRIPYRTVEHPPLFTVEQSQALRGKITGGHTKNLFLKDKKGALFLVSALEDATIELKSLHRMLAAGGRFSFGSAELLQHHDHFAGRFRPAPVPRSHRAPAPHRARGASAGERSAGS